MSTQPSWPASPAPWHIETTLPMPGTGRLTVTGEVDLATAPLLGLRLLTLISDHHPAVIDVDLTDVTFLDCSGISALVTVRNTAERTGAQIRITHPQPIVARIFDILGLLGPFTAPIVPPQYPPPNPMIDHHLAARAERSVG